MPVSIRDLLAGRGHPVTARRDETVAAALQRMRANDFSQLPVVDDEERPIRMITIESALRAIRAFEVAAEQLRVADADVSCATVGDHRHLLEVLNSIRDAGAVAVTNERGQLVGILTTYDTAEHLRRRAEDLMLAEDVEGKLKQLIRYGFRRLYGADAEAKLEEAIADLGPSEPRVRRAIEQYLALAHPDASIQEQHLASVVRGRGTRQPTFDHLTLQDYISLFLNADRWHVFASTFVIDRAAVHKLLERVRLIRNSIAHFRELTNDERDHLRLARDWLEERRPPGEELLEAETLEPTAPVGVADQPAEEAEATPYARLAAFLAAQPEDIDHVVLSFDQVTKVMGADLPPLAFQYRSWWKNDMEDSPQSSEWLSAGWQVSDVDVGIRRVVFQRVPEQERAFSEFFAGVRRELESKLPGLVRARRAPKRSWMTLSRYQREGGVVAQLNLSFARGRRFRAELYIDSGDQVENKALFDELAAERESIEREVGTRLAWERIDEKQASRVALYRDGAITDPPEKLSELAQWAIDAAWRLDRVFRERVER